MQTLEIVSRSVVLKKISGKARPGYGQKWQIKNSSQTIKRCLNHEFKYENFYDASQLA